MGDQNFGKSTHMHRAGFELAALQYDRQMCPEQRSHQPGFVTIFVSQNLKGAVPCTCNICTLYFVYYSLHLKSGVRLSPWGCSLLDEMDMGTPKV